MRGGGLISAIIVVWLVIGVIAAFQRDYLKNTDQNCATLSTIAVTVLVGPLNYAGVNPKVNDCHLPQPSSMPSSGHRPTDRSEGVMIALGIILLILGYVLKVAVLQTIGVILLVIGAVLWVLGSVGRPVGGRRYWY